MNSRHYKKCKKSFLNELNPPISRSFIKSPPLQYINKLKQKEYLQFCETHIRGPVICSGFRKHSFNHFINIVIWLELVGSVDTVIVDQLWGSNLIIAPFFVWKIFEKRINQGLWIIYCHSPVEAHIAWSLVSQLKSAFGLFLWHSSENQHSFLWFTNVLWFFFQKWAAYIYFSFFINF